MKCLSSGEAYSRGFLKLKDGVEIDYNELRKVDGYEEAWKKATNARQTEKFENDSVEKTTPEDRIDDAINELEDELISTILENLLSSNPYRFEKMVLDVLVAMGYGGSREEAAQVTQKSNDEGIDGIINEDRLGLDVIYVQAKRHKNKVGRVDIQNFVGALAGNQAQKGVFITTSSYNDNAIKYAKTVPQKVILIDGTRLANLMIEHNVGVSTERTIQIKKIDSDYFEE